MDVPSTVLLPDCSPHRRARKINDVERTATPQIVIKRKRIETSQAEVNAALEGYEALLRNLSGTFLAFIPQAIALPASRIIALSGPAMGAVSSRAYLVPISTNAEIQVNSVVMVPARISVMGGQEIIILTGGPAANTVVRLGRRQ